VKYFAIILSILSASSKCFAVDINIEPIYGVNISNEMRVGINVGLISKNTDKLIQTINTVISERGNKLSAGIGELEGGHGMYRGYFAKISAIHTNSQVEALEKDVNYLGLDIYGFFIFTNASIGYYKNISENYDDDFFEISLGFGF